MQIQNIKTEEAISILTAMIILLRLGYTSTHLDAAHQPLQDHVNMNEFLLYFKITGPKGGEISSYAEGDTALKIIEALCKKGQKIEYLLADPIFNKIIDDTVTLKNSVEYKKIYDDLLED